jgi:uncharacterized C2H2 Zn-finger protein
MTNMDNFRGKDGNIDWNAYNQAEIENGERCFLCSQFIGWIGSGGRRMCYSCSNIPKKESLDHERFARCPKCKATWDIRESEDYDLFSEGSHSVHCECGYDFEIETKVEYSFESPELLEEEELENE